MGVSRRVLRSSPMMINRGGVAIAVAWALLAACTARGWPSGTGSPPPEPGSRDAGSPHSPGGMAPLHGVALSGPARLRLLVASNPPILVDVDTGDRREVTGLPGGKDRLTWVQPVGQDAVITSTCPGCWPNDDVFYLPRGTTAA